VTTEGDDDRWNGPGQPTVYLATDLAVALAELARHLDPEEGDRVLRRLLGLELDLDGLVDLRDATVRERVGAPRDVEAFRDRDVAREVADRIRSDAAVTGLLVPSMAFLDDPQRANLVLFVERLGGEVAPLVRGQREAGVAQLRLSAAWE
jgi:RES domain-containing protein